jgi:hypothetical protein
MTKRQRGGMESEGAMTEVPLFDMAETGPPKVSLADRFTIPPFTLLDARQGWWKDRKNQWIDLGLKSFEGRGLGSGGRGATPTTGSAGKAARVGGGTDYDAKHARAFTGSGQAKDAFVKILRTKPDRSPISVAEAAAEAGLDEASAKTLALSDGVSIFDPVLCELMIRWFSVPGGTVLDPFAGGSVRGLVAAVLGRTYTGIDLSPNQIEVNYSQSDAFLGNGHYHVDHVPTWITGDALAVLRDGHADLAPEPADVLIGCPPYADLEVYSDHPDDLSNMSYDAFIEAYREIIRLSVERLAPDRFAAWVVGEIRDRKTGLYRSFVPDTIKAFEDAGAAYYNEAILVTMVGSLPLRTARAFIGSRKLGRTHQTLLIFVKGDPKVAAAACDPEVMRAVMGDVEADDLADAAEDLTGMGHG